MDNKIAGMSTEEIAQLAKMFMENKDEVKAMVEMFKPVVGEIVEFALDTIGPEIERIVLRVALGTVSIRKATFDEYVKMEFTREEAMQLMLNDMANSKKLNEAVGDAVKANK